ncbi:hypothetical protein P4637_03375 [Halalkalibacterium halodurans]|uniref:hypothetical protein n=1 Tax=Halalkalibacterium halodurans TaxID=86665 RepID=UPI002E1A84A7|nr:hypothetical protein [Halalkalibacterium halodurans]MED4105540.1 hypothetical protein [Halalkalibacterium halodurans]MED4109254.1 hypothetical protein [Halalkalibacterium halodurans]MED4149732.1 hypothetical protein [Halalkalibacterium halodurans]
MTDDMDVINSHSFYKYTDSAMHHITTQQRLKGLAEYGKPFHPDNHDNEELINHLLSEIADLPVYALALADRIRKQEERIKELEAENAKLKSGNEDVERRDNQLSANPFKIMEEVNGDFPVERMSTTIISFDFDENTLKWNEELGIEFLTLDEIISQAMKITNKNKVRKRIPFIRVTYETGLWGVIFEVGNYYDNKKWIVHGITKGYA